MIMRNALLGVTLATALLGGCKSNPYCLNCNTGDVDLLGVDGPINNVDLAGADLKLPPDLSGPCGPSNGGVEICDGLDNDCNGVVDDVDPTKLAQDPNNCGACGVICNFTGQHQFGACDASSGTPTCKPGACLPGFVDTDGNPANGCDYMCTPSNGGVEICDGLDNDCNTIIDDGFDKENDPHNCNGCGIVCPAVAGNSVGSCVGHTCQAPICNTGYKNLDGNPLNGCEYQCPVFPPTTEICNGIDEDCDGVKDNGATDVGMACNSFCGTVAACVATNSCSYALSTCSNGCCGQCMQGTTVCSSGTKVCQATPPLPALEVCNGLDDNCDGQIDEGINKQTDPTNCNGCGNVCASTTNANSVLAYKCTAGACGIAACKPGFRDLNGLFADGCEQVCQVSPPSVEVCNGLDDDCNGQVDDVAAGSVPPNFCKQTSICSGASPVCCGAAGWLCDYKSVNAGIEIQEAMPYTCKAVPSGTSRLAGTLVFSEAKCDGIDGDCRNGADDSFTQKGQACTVGVGVCAGTSNWICNVGGTALTCPATATPGNATVEECDGKDNNCDGQIDERTPAVTGGPYLAGYVDRFVKVSNAPALWIYQYEASRIDAVPGAGNTAGTSSNTRACSKPNVLPWGSVTRAQAAAACAKIVLSDGSTTARLCTATEWQAACEGPGGAQPNAYSFSTGNTAYTAQVCNDANRTGGPALWRTGFDNGQVKKCYTDWAAAGTLSDLSGNLMEWTSTQVVVGATTYYKARGGAYNSPADGTAPDGDSCEFDFNILPDGFSNLDVGFRCCADVAP